MGMLYEESKSNWTITFRLRWHWKPKVNNLIGYTKCITQSMCLTLIPRYHWKVKFLKMTWPWYMHGEVWEWGQNFNAFSLQEWVFDAHVQKFSFVIPTVAGFMAKVLWKACVWFVINISTLCNQMIWVLTVSDYDRCDDNSRRKQALL